MRRASHCGDFSRRATKRSRHSVARFVGFSGIEEMCRNGDPLSSAVLGAATRRQQSPTRGKEKAAEVKVQASGSQLRNVEREERRTTRKFRESLRKQTSTMLKGSKRMQK